MRAMESVVYEDTPLAEYLEGEGDGHGYCQAPTSSPPCGGSDPNEVVSFAPKGQPIFPSLRLRASRPVAGNGRSPLIRPWSWLTKLVKDAFGTHLSTSENARFLEQMRFTIVGSQLLSNWTANAGYRPPSLQEPLPADTRATKDAGVSYTTSGMWTTLSAAFIAVWSIDWARADPNDRTNWLRVAVVVPLLAALTMLLFVMAKRQYTRYVRKATLDAASDMIANAQSYDSAAATASTLIQEVEIVSRGYRISSPLPPASRLDQGHSNGRRCARIRRTLRNSVNLLVVPYAKAFQDIRPLAIEAELDQYLDIYELSRTDIAEAEDVLNLPSADDAEEGLKLIRIQLQRLHVIRKLYLCSLLAIDVEVFPNLAGWALITDTMHELAHKAASAATSLEKVLSEEQHFPTPITPKQSPNAQHQRLQAQARKFTALSHGLRGLQAKMHILREESDRTLNSSEEVTDLGGSLLDHYDAIGADLESLMQDWKEGRAALTANIDKNERRVSSLSNGTILSGPTTPVSLGGLTAVGESPAAALKILNGEAEPPLGGRNSSDEEVFEAVALPRPRSTMTREERIAKMKEDRARQLKARESADASRYMLKELETVIKMRPRMRTSAGPSSVGSPL